MQPNPSPEIYALIAAGDTASGRSSIRAARRIAERAGAMTHAIVLGGAGAGDGIDYAGIDAAWIVESASDLQPQQAAAALADLLREARIPHGPNTLFIVAPDTPAAEIAVRLAAILDGVALGRCDEVSWDGHAHLVSRKAAFGGRLQVELNQRVGPYFAAIRGPAPEAGDVPPSAGAAVTRLAIEASALPASYTVTRSTAGGCAANLEGAKLVVSGGRGIGGEAGFAALHELAGLLGAAVGGSLPAVDAGWVPVSRQIGQSGKYVSPEVYLAVGISGTPQHLAGIDPRTRIAAINKDADAAIFNRAEIGVVAEWREFLPELAKALGAPH